MGIYDDFIVDPAIQCPHCAGQLKGWQGQHAGDCLFLVWHQGIPSPQGQKVDRELRWDPERLRLARLEPSLIPLGGGKCDSCGRVWRDSFYTVLADARSGIWSQTLIEPEPLPAVALDENFIQCPECTQAVNRVAGQNLCLCNECDRLLWC